MVEGNAEGACVTEVERLGSRVSDDVVDVLLCPSIVEPEVAAVDVR